MVQKDPSETTLAAEEAQREQKLRQLAVQLREKFGHPSGDLLFNWLKAIELRVRASVRRDKFYRLAFWVQSVAILLLYLKDGIPNAMPNVMAQLTSYVEGNIRIYAAEPELSGANPSRSEVIAFVWQETAMYKVPPETVASLCWTESRFRQYKWEEGFPVLVNNNYRAGELDSTDWGICQINDKYHPESFPAARESWQANIKAGIAVFADCQERYQTDAEQIGCYNGFGEGYAGKALAVRVTQFWTGKEPWGVPLPHGYELVRKLHDSDIPGWDYSWPGHPTSQQFPIPVYATLTGTASTFVDGVGNTVVVVRNDSWEVGYLHMDRTDVTNGQSVVWGQEIGIMGNVGKSDFIHLHYWIKNRQSGEFVQDHTEWYIP